MSTSELLNEIFVRYSTTRSVSDGDVGIVSTMFMKLCRDADLLNDNSFRKQDADILFSSLKGNGKHKLDLDSFKTSLTIIASKMGMSLKNLLRHIVAITRKHRSNNSPKVVRDRANSLSEKESESSLQYNSSPHHSTVEIPPSSLRQLQQQQQQPPPVLWSTHSPSSSSRLPLGQYSGFALQHQPSIVPSSFSPAGALFSRLESDPLAASNDALPERELVASQLPYSLGSRPYQMAPQFLPAQNYSNAMQPTSSYDEQNGDGIGGYFLDRREHRQVNVQQSPEHAFGERQHQHLQPSDSFGGPVEQHRQLVNQGRYSNQFAPHPHLQQQWQQQVDDFSLPVSQHHQHQKSSERHERPVERYPLHQSDSSDGYNRQNRKPSSKYLSPRDRNESIVVKAESNEGHVSLDGGHSRIPGEKRQEIPNSTSVLLAEPSSTEAGVASDTTLQSTPKQTKPSDGATDQAPTTPMRSAVPSQGHDTEIIAHSAFTVLSNSAWRNQLLVSEQCDPAIRDASTDSPLDMLNRMAVEFRRRNVTNMHAADGNLSLSSLLEICSQMKVLSHNVTKSTRHSHQVEIARVFTAARMGGETTASGLNFSEFRCSIVPLLANIASASVHEVLNSFIDGVLAAVVKGFTESRTVEPESVDVRNSIMVTQAGTQEDLLHTPHSVSRPDQVAQLFHRMEETVQWREYQSRSDPFVTKSSSTAQDLTKFEREFAAQRKALAAQFFAKSQTEHQQLHIGTVASDAATSVSQSILPASQHETSNPHSKSPAKLVSKSDGLSSSQSNVTSAESSVSSSDTSLSLQSFVPPPADGSEFQAQFNQAMVSSPLSTSGTIEASSSYGLATPQSHLQLKSFKPIFGELLQAGHLMLVQTSKNYLARRKFVVLSKLSLRYYDNEDALQSDALEGEFQITGDTTTTIVQNRLGFDFCVANTRESIMLSTDSASQRESWICALQASIDSNKLLLRGYHFITPTPDTEPQKVFVVAGQHRLLWCKSTVDVASADSLLLTPTSILESIDEANCCVSIRAQLFSSVHARAVNECVQLQIDGSTEEFWKWVMFLRRQISGDSEILLEPSRNAAMQEAPLTDPQDADKITASDSKSGATLSRRPSMQDRHPRNLLEEDEIDIRLSTTAPETVSVRSNVEKIKTADSKRRRSLSRRQSAHVNEGSNVMEVDGDFDSNASITDDNISDEFSEEEFVPSSRKSSFGKKNLFGSIAQRELAVKSPKTVKRSSPVRSPQVVDGAAVISDIHRKQQAELAQMQKQASERLEQVMLEQYKKLHQDLQSQKLQSQEHGNLYEQLQRQNQLIELQQQLQSREQMQMLSMFQSFQQQQLQLQQLIEQQSQEVKLLRSPASAVNSPASRNNVQAETFDSPSEPSQPTSQPYQSQFQSQLQVSSQSGSSRSAVAYSTATEGDTSNYRSHIEMLQGAGHASHSPAAEKNDRMETLGSTPQPSQPFQSPFSVSSHKRAQGTYTSPAEYSTAYEDAASSQSHFEQVDSASATYLVEPTEHYPPTIYSSVGASFSRAENQSVADIRAPTMSSESKAHTATRVVEAVSVNPAEGEYSSANTF